MNLCAKLSAFDFEVTQKYPEQATCFYRPLDSFCITTAAVRNAFLIQLLITFYYNVSDLSRREVRLMFSGSLLKDISIISFDIARKETGIVIQQMTKERVR